MSGEYPNLYQRARKTTCLTQEQASERIGLSAESMKQYELGKRVPPDGVVQRMVEVYGCPWLALEHRKATDTLGVLPEVEIKSLPMASLSLRNRFCAAAGNLDELLLIAEDGVIDDTERSRFDSIVEEMRVLMAAICQLIYAPEIDDKKKERPEAGTSKRSGSTDFSANNCRNIISHRQRIARASFAGEGGASL